MLGVIARNILVKTLVDVIPPLLVEGAGHALLASGHGLVLTGRLLKSAGNVTLEYAHSQRQRNTNPYGPPESQVSIPGVYRSDQGNPRQFRRQLPVREYKEFNPNTRPGAVRSSFQPQLLK